MKRSSLEYPFAFLDWYLEIGFKEDLKNFYYSPIESPIVVLDNIKHIIKCWSPDADQSVNGGYIVVSFEEVFQYKYNLELLNTKQYIEKSIVEHSQSADSKTLYLAYLTNKIKQLNKYEAVSNYLFLEKFIMDITTFIDSSEITKNTQLSYTPSFNILPTTEKDQEQIITELYMNLTKSPSLISCSKEEFAKGFSGQELEVGINWLVLGKNKQVNKVSLFYFINELIKLKLIDSAIINDLNKYVKYVFRDNNGKELKNLKQSKATISNNPSGFERLNKILSLL